MLKSTLVGITLLSLLITSCGGKKEEKKADTTPKVQTQKIGELKIAYYDQDSMKANFEYFKEQDALVTKKQKAFQSTLEKKQKDMEAYYNTFMARAQNNELSQVESEGYQRNLQLQEQELMKYQQDQGAKLEKETLDKLDAIGKKIEQFSKKYCVEHGIDILMIYAKGGQFNYINPLMDVTKEFTAYLNENQAQIQSELKK